MKLSGCLDISLQIAVCSLFIAAKMSILIHESCANWGIKIAFGTRYEYESETQSGIESETES